MNTTLQQIDDLVKSNAVVLFMKGSAMFPQCRFSSAAIQILKTSGVNPRALKTVDVLDNDAMRQGIKEYSKWPAIPVLYVNGELIGGPDIMAEIYESGELQRMLATSVVSESHALQVGSALVEFVKSSFEASELYGDARFNITIDATTFSDELTAFCLTAVQAAIRAHGTNTELLSGFESRIAKEYSKALNETYIARSRRYIEADKDKDPEIINLKTPGDLLSVLIAQDISAQLLIATVLNNAYWENLFFGTITLLKKTGFFHD